VQFNTVGQAAAASEGKVKYVNYLLAPGPDGGEAFSGVVSRIDRTHTVLDIAHQVVGNSPA
jgi:hypothetical protein